MSEHAAMTVHAFLVGQVLDAAGALAVLDAGLNALAGFG